MRKTALGRLTLLCIGFGVGGGFLMGIAAFREGNREWQQYQVGYRNLLLEKIGHKNPALYDRVAGMKPEIRQVVIPAWNTIDRCTTCHMGIDDPLFAEAKVPYRTHPYPALLKKHPVEKFGCTVCHGGQGMATTFEGSSHQAIDNWPVTLVAKGLLQSRCGYCHKNFEAIGADRLIEGREIFKEMHCSGCHQVNGVGGSVGPDLSNFAEKDPSNFSMENLVGPRSKQNWVIEHFRNPSKVSPGSPMRPYPLNQEQIECLASYVLSLSQREFPKMYTPNDEHKGVPGIPTAKVLTAKTEPEAP